MATQIKSTKEANKQFGAKLKLSAKHVDQSHPALVFNMLDAISEQDVGELNAMLAMVSEHMPALVSRFKGYVLVSIDGVEFESGEFTAPEIIALSEVAVLGTAWNTKQPVKRDEPPAKVDPRKLVRQMANKCAKRGLDDAFKSHAPSKAGDQVAEVLAKALADLEAIHAGTYGKAAKPATDEVSKARAKKKAA